VIDAYLADVARHLRVHGRRRRRVLMELEAHLHESAERVGQEEAIRRMGTPEEVARPFAPRAFDRLFEQRDRLAALLMLAAMAASVPLALELHALNDRIGRATAAYFAFLAPTVVVALASNVLVLLRHPLGERLVKPLAVLAGVTAVVTLLSLPPADGVFTGYRQAVAAGYETGGCSGRALAVCAADHSDEIRIDYTAGAIFLTALYAWAVAGWTPRLRRRDRALA
jgi:hypothetical protein